MKLATQNVSSQPIELVLLALVSIIHHTSDFVKRQRHSASISDEIFIVEEGGDDDVLSSTFVLGFTGEDSPESSFTVAFEFEPGCFRIGISFLMALSGCEPAPAPAPAHTPLLEGFQVNSSSLNPARLHNSSTTTSHSPSNSMSTCTPGISEFVPLNRSLLIQIWGIVGGKSTTMVFMGRTLSEVPMMISRSAVPLSASRRGAYASEMGSPKNVISGLNKPRGIVAPSSEE